MENKPNNLYAFPSEEDLLKEGYTFDTKQKVNHGGMSLRDYFAAKAMNGILSSGLAEPTRQSHFNNISEDAYKMADAMLKQREL